MSGEQGPVTPEQLAEIPEEHRRLIGRWLIERGRWHQPSFILTADGAAAAIQDALIGAAIELLAPMTEDSTLAHAAWAVEELLGQQRERPGDQS